jgi:2-methylaconitate cis-trans-isomerase PrpF
MKKTLKEAAVSFSYLNEADDSSGAVFPKDHPLHDPNSPGIENTSQAVTIDGKEVDTGTIELEGTEMIQRYGIDDALPDIFASAAQFTDGTELNDEQLSKLTDDYPETIEQIATGQMEEGSCGYTVTAAGEELDTPGATRGMDADKRTMSMRIREFIKKEISKLK